MSLTNIYNPWNLEDVINININGDICWTNKNY